MSTTTDRNPTSKAIVLLFIGIYYSYVLVFGHVIVNNGYKFVIFGDLNNVEYEFVNENENDDLKYEFGIEHECL